MMLVAFRFRYFYYKRVFTDVNKQLYFHTCYLMLVNVYYMMYNCDMKKKQEYKMHTVQLSDDNRKTLRRLKRKYRQPTMDSVLRILLEKHEPDEYKMGVKQAKLAAQIDALDDIEDDQ